MRVPAAVLAILLALAGCTQTPEQLYRAGKPLPVANYRAGATPQSTADDLLDCRVDAAQSVPANIQVRSTPIWVTPSRRVCRKHGSRTYCETYGGEIMGGETYSVDTNAGLRDQVRGQCMARKGYVSTVVPPCPPGISPTQLKGWRGGLPQYSGTTCFIAGPGFSSIGAY